MLAWRRRSLRGQLTPGCKGPFLDNRAIVAERALIVIRRPDCGIDDRLGLRQLVDGRGNGRARRWGRTPKIGKLLSAYARTASGHAPWRCGPAGLNPLGKAASPDRRQIGANFA